MTAATSTGTSLDRVIGPGLALQFVIGDILGGGEGDLSRLGDFSTPPGESGALSVTTGTVFGGTAAAVNRSTPYLDPDHLGE